MRNGNWRGLVGGVCVGIFAVATSGAHDHGVVRPLPQAAPVSERVIALVFDDGPVEGLTGRVLDALKATGMRATFSVVGKNVEAHPELVRRMVDEGHEVANQTWSQIDLEKAELEDILKEISDTEALVERLVGRKTVYFRPPEGRVPVAVRAGVVAMGYQILEPTLDSGDWMVPPEGHVTRVILGGVTPGAVILAHDSFPRSVAEMPGILEELGRRGFVSVPYGELAGRIASDAPRVSPDVPRGEPGPVGAPPGERWQAR